MGDRGEIFLSSLCQKEARGVDEGGGTILDPIYINFIAFKKWVIERISAYGCLHRVLYFYPNQYARAQVAAAIETSSIWNVKKSIPQRDIYSPHDELPISFCLRWPLLDTV